MLWSPSSTLFELSGWLSACIVTYLIPNVNGWVYVTVGACHWFCGWLLNSPLGHAQIHDPSGFCFSILFKYM
jgi:hypothetical protein